MQTGTRVGSYAEPAVLGVHRRRGASLRAAPALSGMDGRQSLLCSIGVQPLKHGIGGVDDLSEIGKALERSEVGVPLGLPFRRDLRADDEDRTGITIRTVIFCHPASSEKPRDFSSPRSIKPTYPRTGTPSASNAAVLPSTFSGRELRTGWTASMLSSSSFGEPAARVDASTIAFPFR
jgi:hypothetical protein